LRIDFPEDEKMISFGTGAFGLGSFGFCSSDLIVKVPTPTAFKPFALAGLGVIRVSSEADSFINYNFTWLSLKGGLGAEVGLGQVKPYLEGGINYMFLRSDGYTEEDDKALYVQGGLRIKLK